MPKFSIFYGKPYTGWRCLCGTDHPDSDSRCKKCNDERGWQEPMWICECPPWMALRQKSNTRCVYCGCNSPYTKE